MAAIFAGLANSHDGRARLELLPLTEYGCVLSFISGCIQSCCTDSILSMSSGEVFPSAPLSLVAAEVRYPAVTDSNLGMLVQRSVRDALDSDWVIHSSTLQTLEMGVGPAGPHASLRAEEEVARITSRARTEVVTVMPDRFTLEVVDYRGFADFQSILKRTATAVESVLGPDGVSRVGLRYIDEITVSEPVPLWSQWLHSSLMPPTAPDGLVAVEWNGAVQYQSAPDQALVLRYGPSPGTVVDPAGRLRRLRVPAGPVFVLDFDSSWQPQDIPAFTAAGIAETADRLHDPVRGLFDSLILPNLLNVFRKDTPDA